MSLEPVIQRIRSEQAALLAVLEARIALFETRLGQLDHRIQLLERRWGVPPDLENLPKLPRMRRAKIPRRPKMMREQGVGVDPPVGDRAWQRMQ